MDNTADRGGRRSAAWRVSGRVQGVGFRWFVRQEAQRHGLAGDVRNLPDGDVEVRAVGPSGALARLLRDLRRGPPGARVDDVRPVQADPAPDGSRFTIRH